MSIDNLSPNSKYLMGVRIHDFNLIFDALKEDSEWQDKYNYFVNMQQVKDMLNEYVAFGLYYNPNMRLDLKKSSLYKRRMVKQARDYCKKRLLSDMHKK